MWCDAFALERPYAIVASPILVCLVEIGAATGMPFDIFPELDIPVAGVVWTNNATGALDIRDRVLTLHEWQLASLVDDIELRTRRFEIYVRRRRCCAVARRTRPSSSLACGAARCRTHERSWLKHHAPRYISIHELIVKLAVCNAEFRSLISCGSF